MSNVFTIFSAFYEETATMRSRHTIKLLRKFIPSHFVPTRKSRCVYIMRLIRNICLSIRATFVSVVNCVGMRNWFTILFHREYVISLVEIEYRENICMESIMAPHCGTHRWFVDRKRFLSRWRLKMWRNCHSQNVIKYTLHCLFPGLINGNDIVGVCRTSNSIWMRIILQHIATLYSSADVS